MWARTYLVVFFQSVTCLFGGAAPSEVDVDRIALMDLCPDETIRRDLSEKVRIHTKDPETFLKIFRKRALTYLCEPTALRTLHDLRTISIADPCYVRPWCLEDKPQTLAWFAAATEVMAITPNFLTKGAYVKDGQILFSNGDGGGSLPLVFLGMLRDVGFAWTGDTREDIDAIHHFRRGLDTVRTMRRRTHPAKFLKPAYKQAARRGNTEDDLFEHLKSHLPICLMRRQCPCLRDVRLSISPALFSPYAPDANVCPRLSPYDMVFYHCLMASLSIDGKTLHEHRNEIPPQPVWSPSHTIAFI